MRREMDRMLESFVGLNRPRAAGVFPAINVSEDRDAIYVRSEVPGLGSDHLDVSFENDTLTIAGEREAPVDEQEVAYHRREREWGAFRRSLSIPTPIDGDRVEARYDHGVLTVKLPKAAEARPRRITVQSGAA